MVGSYFLMHSHNLCLLIGMFRPLHPKWLLDTAGLVHFPSPHRRLELAVGGYLPSSRLVRLWKIPHNLGACKTVFLGRLCEGQHKCSGVFHNGHFSPPPARSTNGFFHNIHGENLVKLLEARLTKVLWNCYGCLQAMLDPIPREFPSAKSLYCGEHLNRRTPRVPATVNSHSLLLPLLP